MNTISNTPLAALATIEACRKNKSTSLDLCGLDLTEIPKEIADLTWLTELRISKNQIKKIEGLSTLINLESLELENNQIKKMKGLSTLTKLKVLYLENNQIKKMKGLSTLTKLEVLYLENNQIKKIKGLRTLTSLTSLQIQNNKITNIEPLLAFIPKGLMLKWDDKLKWEEKSIIIKDNPLIKPDIETAKLGNDAILAYFTEKKRAKRSKKYQIASKVIQFMIKKR